MRQYKDRGPDVANALVAGGAIFASSGCLSIHRHWHDGVKRGAYDCINLFKRMGCQNTTPVIVGAII